MTIAAAGKTRSQRRPRWLKSAVLTTALIALLVFSARPIRVEYYLSQGRKALAATRYEAALTHFRTAREIDPQRADVSFWLARASRKAGDLDGIRRFLDEARRLGYEDERRLGREWLLVLAETGRLSEAEPHLKEMLVHPGKDVEDAAEICDAFTKGYCLNLRFWDARKLLDVWELDFPGDFRPLLRRGQIEASDERWSHAAEEFRKALKRAPDEPIVKRELARALFKNQNYAEAEELLKRLVKEDPADIQSLQILAEIANERKDKDASLTYLQHILKHQPQDFSARLLLAKVELASGDASQAVAQAEALAAEWPEDLNVQYVLAQSLRAAGRIEDAERVLAVYGKLEKNLKQIEALMREIRSRPAEPQLRYELGLLQLRHLSRSEGVAWLQSVFQFDPRHTGAHRALAEYFSKVGDMKLAQRHERMAIDVSQD
jgi:tetratricopeptide (TPR) repeat protein